MLLWLAKHLRPDINNAGSELSKSADGATEAHWKELLRAIEYVLKTQQLALKMKPVKNGELFSPEGISDSNYAEDKETRFSVYAYIIYFCGVSIA
jgi:hypothetical protein